MRAKILQATLLALAIGGAAAPKAEAVDGVIEINQARALAGNVSPGDSPGFPVTINTSGSYRLTGPLEVADGTTTAILINAGDVAIDLNGFRIACQAPCGAGSTGRGIDVAVDAANIRTTIRNGTVQGMGNIGVAVLQESVVEDVMVVSNGLHGILGFDQVAVRRCQVIGNSGRGIWVSATAVVSSNRVVENLADGIFAEFGSIVHGNSVVDNAGDGIVCNNHCNVFRNSVASNGGIGIEVVHSLARDNVVARNDGLGLSGADYGFAGNQLQSNNSNGAQTDGGAELGTNVCGIDTVCP